MCLLASHMFSKGRFSTVLALYCFAFDKAIVNEVEEVFRSIAIVTYIAVVKSRCR